MEEWTYYIVWELKEYVPLVDESAVHNMGISLTCLLRLEGKWLVCSVRWNCRIVVFKIYLLVKFSIEIKHMGPILIPC